MTNPDLKLDAQTVTEWIKEHPRLLIDNPDLITVLEWPHDTPPQLGATSLMEFQVRRLKADISKLKEQLHSLSEVAKDNEQLMLRLHLMTLSLMALPNLEDFIYDLIDTLKNQFEAHSVALHLFERPKAFEQIAEVLHWDKDQLAWLTPIDTIYTPQCGRFTQSKIRSLFPVTDLNIQSAAAVPIAGIGLLAIGSTDQSKFQPQMGTLFLELLATTIGHCLDGMHPTVEAE